MIKIKNISLIAKLLFTATIMLSNTKVIGVELDLKLGFDSNPFQLNKNELSGFYSKLDASHEFVWNTENAYEYFISIDFKGTKYEENRDNADAWRGIFKAGIDSHSFETSIGKIDGEFNIQVGHRDSTFTSRTTGQQSTSGGVNVKDRYDNNWIDFKLDLRNRINKKTSVYLDTKYRLKDYSDDYSALALDRLDYSQFDIGPRLKHKISDKIILKANFEYSYRDYVNRLAQTLAGVQIAGKNLQYKIYEYEVSLAYELTENWDIEIGYALDKRQDNASGRFDKTQNTGYLEITYEPNENQKYEFEIKYINREFDNATVDVAGLVEDIREKQGWKISVDSENKIEVYDIENLYFTSSLEIESFDAQSPTLAYNRVVAEIGLSKEF